MAKNTFVVKGKDADLSIFPIGSIYMTMGNYNPSIYFGGTWEQVSKGKVLVGADESQPEFNTVRKTGGEKKHKLTRDELPKIQGALPHVAFGENKVSGDFVFKDGPNATYEGGQGSVSNNKIYELNIGKNQSHSNLQPYLTCFIWERIA